MSEEERERQRAMDRAGDRRRVANHTDEEREALLVRRRETTAKRMAKMNEEELAIYRAKESAIRSKTRKRKWLGNSGIMTYNGGTRISTLDLSSLGTHLVDNGLSNQTSGQS